MNPAMPEFRVGAGSLSKFIGKGQDRGSIQALPEFMVRIRYSSEGFRCHRNSPLGLRIKPEQRGRCWRNPSHQRDRVSPRDKAFEIRASHSLDCEDNGLDCGGDPNVMKALGQSPYDSCKFRRECHRTLRRFVRKTLGTDDDLDAEAHELIRVMA